jgi:hypothetical protein
MWHVVHRRPAPDSFDDRLLDLGPAGGGAARAAG